MSENSFYEALFRIMWDMEVDIFTQPEKSLALLADIVPKCKKQRKRLKAMYDCGAMEKIEQAVADRSKSKLYLTLAVKLIVDSIEISDDKAVFAVNQIVGLWEDMDKLKRYEPEKLRKRHSSIPVEIQAEENEEEEEEEEEYEEKEDNEGESGGDEMLFLQDMTDEENNQEEAKPEENTENSEPQPSEPEEQPAEPKEPILSKLVNSWCRTDCEDGRPYMFACPVGWFMMIMCSIPGLFMIYDINMGDKLVIPTFVFMFTVLTGKRLYKFESAGRLSLYILVMYLIAMFKSMWLGTGNFRYACILVAAAALMVFNSGRIGTWLDESKKRPAVAYLIIVLFSAVVTAGAYAVQHAAV